jgi:hypothetical protein
MDLPGFTAEESLKSPSERYRLQVLNNSSRELNGLVPAAVCWPVPVFTCEPGIEGTCSLSWTEKCI